MDRSSTRHRTGRRLLLAAVLVVPALTLGGLVHAAEDDGPLDTEWISTPARPPQPTTTPPAGDPAVGPDRDAVPPPRESSAPVPDQPTDPPPSSPTDQATPGPAAESTPPPTAATDSASEQAADGEAQVTATQAEGTQTAEAQAAAQAAEALATVAAAGARAAGSVEVVVLGADGREQLASPGAGTPTWTASLSKTFVVQQLLDPDGARQPLTAADMALLERALTISDDSAMNTLWARFDGPALVAEAATEFGLTGTAPPADPSQWGEATTTAHDYAGFLHRLRFGLDDAALATLTGWLHSTSDRAADGFDQAYGLLSPTAHAGGPVAAKQGWMCCVDGRRQLHSAGNLADGRTVVLLGDFPASTSWAAGRTALDQAAQGAVTLSSSRTTPAPGAVPPTR